jgi:predicted RNase H-like HicB family nuclease
MRYLYEAFIVKDEDGYTLDAPDLPGCFTWGDTIEDVARKAPDAIETHLGAYLAKGDEVPAASFGHVVPDDGIIVMVSVEASAASVGAPCLMASTVAERLSVTPARVSHLLRDGLLEGYRAGRETMVTVASLERYEATPRKAGRPRKTVTV